MAIEVAYISDQRFLLAGGVWYTTASFPLDFFSERLDLARWTFWGRLGEADDPGRLFPLVPPPRLAGKVFFEGPWGQRTGLPGYLRNGLQAQARLRHLVRSADLVWLKQPTAFAMLAEPHCRDSQVIVSQQVGDAVAGLALTYPHLALLGHVSAWSCRSSARRATVASFVSRDLARRYGGGRPDVVVANESRVTADMVLEAPVAQTAGPLEVVFVGRLAPEKRVEDLLAALVDVPRARLTVVGDGPKRAALEEQARALGIGGRVTWSGYVPWGRRLLEILRRSSVLVLPSATEGLPLVLVEAMSQGLPVVATRAGGIPEVVEHGRSGLLVDVKRPDQLAAALRLLGDDPARRLAMAHAALAAARRNTLEVQTGRLLERIAQATGLRHSRRSA